METKITYTISLSPFNVINTLCNTPIFLTDCNFFFLYAEMLLMELSKIADDKDYFTSSWRGIG